MRRGARHRARPCVRASLTACLLQVIIHTTVGPLEIELWPKQAPKATRNFVQLCLERYYDQLPFHRIVRDFCAQTGAGEAGRCVYGAPSAAAAPPRY